jgi:hypothetical protein
MDHGPDNLFNNALYLNYGSAVLMVASQFIYNRRQPATKRGRIYCVKAISVV